MSRTFSHPTRMRGKKRHAPRIDVNGYAQRRHLHGSSHTSKMKRLGRASQHSETGQESGQGIATLRDWAGVWAGHRNTTRLGKSLGRTSQHSYRASQHSETGQMSGQGITTLRDWAGVWAGHRNTPRLGRTSQHYEIGRSLGRASQHYETGQGITTL
ncbi:hypothetical protein Bpfe_001492 [Biomphalaria pfeifferi]|uniref:Uncharacterized protein n=1 Tax=Biomphalaria pfeifferi TaxID=112525 RepID=A0AAD8CAD5_BIOPF|nr:hypothetical protein Bpfe_001492 [Biomphalaria pfeifferi]